MWGLKGIIILKSLLLLFFLLFVFLNLRKQGLSDLPAVLLVTGVFFISQASNERPQLFTFLIFSAVYYLLEDYRINRAKKAFLIPLLVMILSNMHPGYIVCILLITLYIAGEIGRRFFNRDNKDGFLAGLSVIWALTLLFSMLNPNGATALALIFSIHAEHTRHIIEWMSPFYLYMEKLEPVNYIYVSFLVLSMLSLRYLRKIGITHMLLLAVFIFMSIISKRYMIFYICISAPILARAVIYLGEENVLTGLTGFLREKKVFLNILAFVFGVFLVINTVPAFSGYIFKSDTSQSVPEGAADFLENVNIRGNMFNEYAFGGYLIWRLYPERKVFIDSRGLEIDILNEYNIVAGAFEGQALSWRDIIEKYKISYIVTSPLEPSGEIFPIVEKLFDSKDWVLIYYDHLSLIFLKNDPVNADLVQKYSRVKIEGLRTILIQASARALYSRINPNYLISMGKVFFKEGRFDDAKKAFTMAFDIDPDNAVLKFWLEKLEANTKKIKK